MAATAATAVTMACRSCLLQVAPKRSRATTPTYRSFSTWHLSSTTTPTIAGPSRIPTTPQPQWRSRSLQSKRAFSSIQDRQHTPPRRHAATMAKVQEPALPPALSLEVPLAVTPPSLQAIKEEGYLDDDVELVPEDDAYIVVTPDAVKQLVKITSKESPEILEKGQLALRVGVESGGCHGYQYIMEIVEQRGVDDYVMQPIGYDCIPIVVDLVSLGLLKGATLHHATELIGSSFRIQENPQAKEGGNCGCGVSWELK